MVLVLSVLTVLEVRAAPLEGASLAAARSAPSAPARSAPAPSAPSAPAPSAPAPSAPSAPARSAPAPSAPTRTFSTFSTDKRHAPLTDPPLGNPLRQPRKGRSPP